MSAARTNFFHKIFNAVELAHVAVLLLDVIHLAQLAQARLTGFRCSHSSSEFLLNQSLRMEA